jgi:hypothetical protein
MNIVKIAARSSCLVLGSLAVACGGVAATVPAAAQPTGAAPLVAEGALPATMSAGVFVGSSCGESWRPEVQQWQAAILHAIGRDNQYGLFQYFVGDGTVYVGLPYKALGLTGAEMEAASRVEPAFTNAAEERDHLWLAHAWASRSGALARAE